VLNLNKELDSMLIDSLRTEFDHEAQTTRKHLERLPHDKLDWRPHEKSFTAGALASHIAEMAGWADVILKQDGLDFDPATYKPYRRASRYVSKIVKWLTEYERVPQCRVPTSPQCVLNLS
jgi:uncharacterized damage-inducible protein DinB